MDGGEKKQRTPNRIEDLPEALEDEMLNFSMLSDRANWARASHGRLRVHVLPADWRRDGYWGAGNVLRDLSNVFLVDMGGCIHVEIGSSWHLKNQWVTDETVGCVAQQCLLLESLNLNSCSNITDVSLRMLRSRNTLRSLNLRRCTTITDTGVATLRNLDTLNLSGCRISGAALVSLARNCPALRALNVGYNSQIRSVDALAGLENLRELNVEECRITSVALLRHLRKLNVSENYEFTDLRVSPELQYLDVSGCFRLQQDLRPLQNLPLRTLSLRGCRLFWTGTLLATLEKLTELRRLDLFECGSSSPMYGITDDSLASLGTSTLTDLDLGRCGVSDAGVMALNCPGLQRLGLETSPGVTNTGIAAVAEKFSDLQELNVAFCENINDGGLMALKNLTRLDMAGCNITDTGVIAVARNCPDLEVLNLWDCTNITDEGVRELSRCGKLYWLSLEGCMHVSDAVKDDLASGCPLLKKVSVGTREWKFKK